MPKTQPQEEEDTLHAYWDSVRLLGALKGGTSWVSVTVGESMMVIDHTATQAAAAGLMVRPAHDDGLKLVWNETAGFEVTPYLPAPDDHEFDSEARHGLAVRAASAEAWARLTAPPVLVEPRAEGG